MAHQLQRERISRSNTQRTCSFCRLAEQSVELRQKDAHRNQKSERQRGDFLNILGLDTNKNMVYICMYKKQI